MRNNEAERGTKMKKITENIYYVGGSDRHLDLFEGAYPLPAGVTYNSYLIVDEKTVLMDAVDLAIGRTLIDNVEEVLGDRGLDFLVVSHMEPDHSATAYMVLEKYPECKLVISEKAFRLFEQFEEELAAKLKTDDRLHLIKEGSELEIGSDKLMFIETPMVHWPEVVMSYLPSSGVLFSADAFGSFGADDGELFGSREIFDEYVGEARRYYTNIVGKYGLQVKNALNKVVTNFKDIKIVAPLHGLLWRNDDEGGFGLFLNKYQAWASYEPEVNGVLIVFGSIYGNTAKAALKLASDLNDKGVKTKILDATRMDVSYIVSAAFEYSHIAILSITHDAMLFTPIATLCEELKNRQLANRTFALAENGSWAPVAARGMREILSGLKNSTILDKDLSFKSSLKSTDMANYEEWKDQLLATIPAPL